MNGTALIRAFLAVVVVSFIFATLPSRVAAAALSVPQQEQLVNPPDGQDDGGYDCLPASVSMVLQTLVSEQAIPQATGDYTSVRRAFRQVSPGGRIDPTVATRVVPTLTNNTVSAIAGIISPPNWQAFVTGELSVGIPVVAVVNDWKRLAAEKADDHLPSSPHAVVLTSISDSSVTYNDPWYGKAFTMPTRDFGDAWSYSDGTFANWATLIFTAVGQVPTQVSPPATSQFPAASPTTTLTAIPPQPSTVPSNPVIVASPLESSAALYRRLLSSTMPLPSEWTSSGNTVLPSSAEPLRDAAPFNPVGAFYTTLNSDALAATLVYTVLNNSTDARGLFGLYATQATQVTDGIGGFPAVRAGSSSYVLIDNIVLRSIVALNSNPNRAIPSSFDPSQATSQLVASAAAAIRGQMPPEPVPTAAIVVPPETLSKLSSNASWRAAPLAVQEYIAGLVSWDADRVWNSLNPNLQRDLSTRGVSLATEQKSFAQNKAQGQVYEFISSQTTTNSDGTRPFVFVMRLRRPGEPPRDISYSVTLDSAGKIARLN